MSDAPATAPEQLSMVEQPVGAAFDHQNVYHYGLTPREAHAPFYAQLDSLPQGLPHRGPIQHHDYGAQGSPNRLDMNSLGGALPDNGRAVMHRDFVQPEFVGGGHLPHHPPATLNFQSPQAADHQAAYYMQQPFPYGNMAMQPQRSPHHLKPDSSSSMYGSFPSFVPQMPPQGYSGPGIQAPFIAPYGRPNVLPEARFSHPSGMGLGAPVPGQTAPNNPASFLRDSARSHRNSSSDVTPTYPRGPPRKPKQSGHALWVGNLPPGTTVTDLKDHFSRDATKDIESLFLIFKSNCAFVNYRTEAACAAAMSRFHDSRFNGVRLVCRLRRGSVATNENELGSGPIIKGVQLPDAIPRIRSDVVVADSFPEHILAESPNEAHDPDPNTAPLVVPEKYFIVKSLTLQDLDASVHNGIWATQSHNEAVLNKAFEACYPHPMLAAENVYLIFSANKSGEYFGYARMMSPISGKLAPTKPAPPVEVPESSNGPTSVPTPATEWAPKGRIVDDSARGTIFWEADRLEVDSEASKIQEESVERDERENQSVEEHGQDWGKPFKIEWLSTNRLPFYRTRGLRNPWNANREVKIARDGTELEPSIGRRLVQMFHRPAAPVMPQAGPMMQPMMQPMMPLY